ncbi:folate-binding protein [Xinfangfangia sp. CPCC 101601]|uniref:Folate-binding protein n=1 Tax=Pseudogemmobacter lacusdianii TaxID=3069608 RepID=A0ABU0VZ30_9RHOB|nr:folate-binding protein [Xinfangfangia sp. CPCC 101601]MDQ2067012.1 folate-binding protein [Xinfangfangia sp. CPCC 101601]
MGEAVLGRSIWQLTGKDVLAFLQGLVSNDVLPLAQSPGIVWAALLTPQGKYLADFFVIRRPDAPEGEILLDLPEALSANVIKRLQMYKLRADVQIAPSSLQVQRGLDPAPATALPDPRHQDLGWRLYSDSTGAPPAIDWDALRVELMVPEYPADLVPDESYILEMGFERLNGVSFRKGCYVGQEVTARMKHKTELKKGLVRLSITGTAAAGTPITIADGREAGRLGTVSGGQALAHARFDRLSDTLLADMAKLAADKLAK